MNDNTNKTVYYLAKQFDACFYFRTLVPGKYLERNHGWKCYYDKIDDIFEMKDDGSYNFDRIKENRREILDKADLIVLQRGTDYGHLQFIRYVKCHLKKPILYECFVYDANIMTDKGLLKIGDIVNKQLDVKVVSDDGRFYEIAKYFSRSYEGKLYSITPWYISEEIKCTESHKLIVRKKEETDFKEILARDISPGDFLKIPFIDSEEAIPHIFDILDYTNAGWEGDGSYVFKKAIGNRIKRFVSFDCELSRLFGYFLAQGSIDEGDAPRAVVFSFNSEKKHFHEDVEAIILNKFGLKCHFYINDENHCVRIMVTSCVLANFFRDIFGKVIANTKVVPKFYFNKDIDPDLISHLCIGFFKGDGCSAKENTFNSNGSKFRHARVTSSSKTMLFQMHNLLLRLDIIGGIYKLWRSGKEGQIRGQKFKSNDGFELRVNVVDGIDGLKFKDPCRYKTKNKNLNGKIDHVNRYAEIKIRKISIEEVKDITVYNLCILPRHRYNVLTFASQNSDDNYFDVDPSNTGYRYFAPRKPEISQMMSEVDGMTVTVPELVNVYSPYNTNIHVIPNFLDFEKIDKAPSLANDSRLLACSVYRCPKDYIEDGLMGAVKKIASDLLKKDNVPQTDENIDKMINGPVQFNIPVTFDAYKRMREDDNNLIIGWGGSPTHVMDIEIVRKPLLKVMEKYRRVNFTMVGFIHMLSLLQSSPYGVNVRRWLIDMDYKRFCHFNYVGVKNYFSLYKSLSFDIGLAPVAPIKFNKSKSGLKVIEYMSLGVYPMASDFDTYHGLMEKEGSANNEIGRGRICKTEDDWENNFYEVLNDHDMRAESIYHNDQYVRKYFDADLESYRWDGIYRKFL